MEGRREEGWDEKRTKCVRYVCPLHTGNGSMYGKYVQKRKEEEDQEVCDRGLGKGKEEDQEVWKARGIKKGIGCILYMFQVPQGLYTLCVTRMY